jgi:histidine triad (HIT) family protein
VVFLEECIFCRIANGGIPSENVVYDDADAMAFLDINPASAGHTLVIPKKHFKDIMEIPDAELSKLMSAVKKVARAVKKGTGADGINVIQNNGEAAGQAVHHIHFHIIPRNDGDGITLCNQRHKYLGDEMKSTAEKIRRSF